MQPVLLVNLLRILSLELQVGAGDLYQVPMLMS